MAEEEKGNAAPKEQDREEAKKVGPKDDGADCEYDFEKAMYESHLQRKRDLDAAHLSISERYSHWLITIAGAGLALSLTFLEKIAPSPIPGSRYLLLLCWLFLVASLLGGFIAIYYSGNAVRRQRDISEYKYRSYCRLQGDQSVPAMKEDDCINKFSERIPTIDKFSVGSLIVGVICLCLFSFVNIPEKNKRKDPGASRMVIDVNLSHKPFGATQEPYERETKETGPRNLKSPQRKFRSER